GADIDARDVDHESTPAQYMVRTRQHVARYLISRGCSTDLLMAAALGEEQLAMKILSDDPEVIRMRVTDEYFPMVGGKSGGTIYQRSEEHTSELQSRENLVCRLLLE